MIHINTGGKHEWLTDEQLKEKHPEVHAALHTPAPFKEYGEKMRKMRQRRGLTVRELAKILGWDLTTVSGIETGRIEPTGEQVEQYQLACLRAEQRP